MEASNTGSPTREAMFRSMRDMRGYRIYAVDGAIGEIEDFLFDDERWVLRHFVVKMKHREVLLSPLAYSGADWDSRKMHVNLTLQQIAESPDIDTDLPISRKEEQAFYDFYGWPYYWSSMYPTGGGQYPYQTGMVGTPIGRSSDNAPEYRELTKDEIHLRSVNEVIGYHVEAVDGSIGRVEDFILHDIEFHIQFAVIDTSPWWFGGKVLFPTNRIQNVSWPGRLITLDATQHEVKEAPDWDHAKPVCSTYAECLHQHYKR